MLQQTDRAIPREDLGETLREFDPSTEGFIAGQVLPDRPVRQESATVSVIGRENMKRVDTKHANGATFNRTDLCAKDLTYACVDHGLEGKLTDKDRKNYETDFDAELETTQDIERKVLVEREIRVKDLVFNTSTFTGDPLYTDVSSAPWATVGTNIMLQVMAAKTKVRQNTGMVANALVIGAAAMDQLLVNTGITARFPGVAIITEDMIRSQLSAIFGLEELIVGACSYDSANEGQDFSASEIWPNTYALVCKINKGSLKTGGIGRTFRWTGMDPNEEPTVSQYRENQTESDIFRVREYTDEKLFDEHFGHLLEIN